MQVLYEGSQLTLLAASSLKPEIEASHLYLGCGALGCPKNTYAAQPRPKPPGLLVSQHFKVPCPWRLQGKEEKIAGHGCCQVPGGECPSASLAGKFCNLFHWQHIFYNRTSVVLVPMLTPIPMMMLTISWFSASGWGHAICSIYGALQTSNKKQCIGWNIKITYARCFRVHFHDCNSLMGGGGSWIDTHRKVLSVSREIKTG